MNTRSGGQRITFKHARPNPLFQEWLEELYEEAQQKKSKLEPMLKEALTSLSKYPLPLQSGAECIVLKGFEKKLCLHLDKRLEVYNENMRVEQVNESGSDSSEGQSDSENTGTQATKMPLQSVAGCKENSQGLSGDECIGTQIAKMPLQNVPSSRENSQHNINDRPSTSNVAQSTSASNSVAGSRSNSQKTVSSETSESHTPSSTTSNKKPRGPKSYKPAHRSGGYALLVTLLMESMQNPDKTCLTKEELIEKAQTHSEESFTRPKPDTFYTAWSNMTKLISKGLVQKSRNKKMLYSLTKQGIYLAAQLLEDSKSIPTVNDFIFNDVISAVSTNGNSDIVCCDEDIGRTEDIVKDRVIEMTAGSFDIILLIDKNETGGVSKKNDPTVAQFKKYPDLKHEYRSLKVGDFTWVARHKVNNEEFVLPYVVERKRMDDLGASIKDGRFHEQKFRLRKCGLDNVIYLVENYGGNKHVGLPVQSLMQALANTRLQDMFKVHITDSLTNSARCLAMMTKRLTIRYKDKNLIGRSDEPRTGQLMTFEYFNKASAKTKPLTVTETFIKMLLQLKGMSVEKALAITNTFSTPYALLKAYEGCDQKEGQFLLANLKYGDLNRNVGPIISKSIYQLFSSIGVEQF